MTMRMMKNKSHKHWVIVGPSGKPWWDWYCPTQKSCKDYFGTARDWKEAKKNGYAIRRVETKIIAWPTTKG